MWKPEPITLTWPIDHDGARLEKLPLRAVTKAEYDKHVLPLKDGTQQFVAMATLATGLPEKVIKTLKRPDFNSLAEWLRKMSGKNADEFRTISAEEFLKITDPEWPEYNDPNDYRQINDHEYLEITDPDAPKLLVPITSDDGGLIYQVTLEVPALEATILMEKKTDIEDQNLFINMHCTGLSREELGRLSLPDWNQIQARITRFLADTGDYFCGVTSTR